MKQSQAEIQEIQAKLQAMKAGKVASQPQPSLPPMVELTPNTSVDRQPRQRTAIAPPPTQPIHQPAASSPATAPKTVYTKQDVEQLAAAVKLLQQQSATYMRQTQVAQPAPRQETPEQQVSEALNRLETRTTTTPQTQVAQPAPRQGAPKQPVFDAMKRLETQAERINQLSAAQEAAMLELKAIADRVERDWRAAELAKSPLSNTEADIPAICEYLSAAVPIIEKGDDGRLVINTRSVDLFRAEREAAFNAQHLRQRTPAPSRSQARPQKRSRRSSTPLALVWKQVAKWVDQLSQPKPTSRHHRPQAAQAVEMPAFSLQDMALWVVGSVLVRVVLDVVLITNPQLWLGAVALIIAPAALAIYRTTVAPESGFIWGYRLLLVMVGLLLGGRLV